MKIDNQSIIIFEIMSHQPDIKFYLGTLVAMITSLQLPALAQSLPPQINQIFPNTFDIKDIGESEYYSNGQQKSFANNFQELLKTPQFATITRNYQWQMRVPTDRLQFPIKVTYNIKSVNGESNKLALNSQSTTASFPITIGTSQVDVLQDTDKNLVLLKGSVQLLFDAANAGIEGKYEGKLSVCVKSQDNGCL
jgi:hypothetical protein